MTVSVKLYGILRYRYPRYDTDKGLQVETKVGITILELFEMLGFTQNEVGLILLDGMLTKDVNSVVKTNSTVELFSVIPHGG